MTDEKEFVREICRRDVDFSQWYIDVVRKAELADYAPVRGCMVIRPYGYAIWELIRDALDEEIKATGHQNAYFPLLIPESFLRKEAEHVEGFAPQVGWVTVGGDQELEERLALRPTSEAIICEMYSKWIRSWRDLPVMINQWANVIRWEKVTRLFLRTTEFLWQEGHTAHMALEEAEEEALKMLDVYDDTLQSVMAIPAYKGVKTAREKFPGAEETYTIEALMPDGRALQAGTSHNLGQHFAKAFNITYLDKNNEQKYVYQTSWGVTSRLIGALVMIHGDDYGLKLPPRCAPYQVVVVPIVYENSKTAVLNTCAKITATLKTAGVRTHLDDRDGYTPGWKFNEWELRGVPLRVEVGPKDLEQERVLAVRRDTREKKPIPLKDLKREIGEILGRIQVDMLEAAIKYRNAHTTTAKDRGQFLTMFEGRPGFVRAPWCGVSDCEARIQEETGATLRFLKLEHESAEGEACAGCEKEATVWAYFAKAY